MRLAVYRDDLRKDAVCNSARTRSECLSNAAMILDCGYRDTACASKRETWVWKPVSRPAGTENDCTICAWVKKRWWMLSFLPLCLDIQDSQDSRPVTDHGSRLIISPFPVQGSHPDEAVQTRSAQNQKAYHLLDMRSKRATSFVPS